MPVCFASWRLTLSRLIQVTLAAWILIFNLPRAYAVDISDSPLETQLNSAPPNLIFILDNSGSMDWEFMTDEPNGLFEGRFYLFADSAYDPAPDHTFGTGHALSAIQRRRWRSQWAGSNRLYYNPKSTYRPWPETQNHRFGPADLNLPWSDPANTSADSARLDMSAAFFSVIGNGSTIHIANAHYFTVDDANANGVVDLNEAVYLVTWADADGDRKLDVSHTAGNDLRLIYRFTDDGDNLVEDNELSQVLDESEKNRVRAMLSGEEAKNKHFRTDGQDLQNFTNWFSYYRRRELTAKAVVAAAVSGLKHFRVGFYAINQGPRIEVQPVQLDGESGIVVDNNAALNFENSAASSSGQDRSDFLLDRLYALNSSGATPLRRALDQVGRYFDQNLSSDLGASPYQTDAQGGACQRSFAIVMTDGFWNGEFAGIGNVDGSKGFPYADGWSDTLADIAMYYYDKDLSTELADQVPRQGCDQAAHQHLATYTLSFGVKGTLDTQDINQDGRSDVPGYGQDPCFANPATPRPSWPEPLADQQTVIDDLWHASVNGRGLYFSAGNPEDLLHAMTQVVTHIGHSASAATVSTSGEQLVAESVVYQTRYRSDNWTGEVLALAYNPDTGQVQSGPGQELWNAARQLEQPGVTFDSRRIVTYGGRLKPARGVPFRYDQLSDVQKTALGSDLIHGSEADQKARDVLEYIRGRDNTTFRLRTGKLGDMVHSAPVVVGDTVFAGANDGMLHAFDTLTGDERFAYIPHLVFGRLKALSAPDYAGNHQFYVDATPYAGEVMVDLYKRHTYLVGGLGKGGQGYYCLLIGQRQRTQSGNQFGPYQEISSVDRVDTGASEHAVSQLVRWEYPPPVPEDDDMDNDGDGLTDEEGEFDPDMGYSFGQGYAVDANSPDESFRPVAIFGNGYNSFSGHAVLYVLDVDSGVLVRKIDTGAAGDNGLSIPALIDVNLDRRVDYVYAGDLMGNLWKFDLTAEDPARWGLAYGEDLNGNGVIDAADGDQPRPVFQARGQSITGRPDIMLAASACAAQVPGYMVIFGTGRYLGASDRRDFTRQSIYGIWDYGDDGDDSEFLGFLTDRTSGQLSMGLQLVRQEVGSRTAVDGSVTRQLDIAAVDFSTVDDSQDADNIRANNQTDHQEPNPQHFAGWFIDFPVPPDPNADPGERVTGNVAIRGGNAVLVSFAPSAAPCSGDGISWVYVVNGCFSAERSSGSPEGQPIAWRHDSKINDNPLIVKTKAQPQMDQILAGDSSGRLLIDTFPGEVWGRVYWRQNIH